MRPQYRALLHGIPETVDANGSMLPAKQILCSSVAAGKEWAEQVLEGQPNTAYVDVERMTWEWTARFPHRPMASTD